MRAKRCENLKEAWKQVAWEKNEGEACYATKMKMALSTYSIDARWTHKHHVWIWICYPRDGAAILP